MRNSAGKTTTVQILSTLPAGASEVRVAGHDVGTEPELVRAAIGVIGQFSALDDLLTATDRHRAAGLAAARPALQRNGTRQRPHASAACRPLLTGPAAG